MSLYQDTPESSANVERQPPRREIQELGLRLPRLLHCGTEGWADARWRGIVFSAQSGSQHLRNYGLTPYSQYPLFNMVALPSRATPYRESELLRFEAAVDETFRFLWTVDAHLDPMLRDAKGIVRGANPQFLVFNEPWFEQWMAMPQRMLGSKLGPVVLRLGAFDRMTIKHWQQRGALAPLLDRFLSELRTSLENKTLSLTLGLEIQNTDWLTPRMMTLLAQHKVHLVVNLSNGMPNIRRQQQALAFWEELTKEEDASHLLIHWHSSPSLSLGWRPLPGNKLLASDPLTRSALAALMERYLARSRPVWVWVGNRAEGSAPLTIEALARVLDRRRLEKITNG